MVGGVRTVPGIGACAEDTSTPVVSQDLLEMNAILEPSGDHVGAPSIAGSVVSLVCPDPSTFIR